MKGIERGKLLSRLGFVLLVLLSGIVLIPFQGISAEKLNWMQFAGVYQPVLTVNVNTGAPGSSFLFEGTGYQPNAEATIYFDGDPVGTVMTDENGDAEFLIRTVPTDPTGQYFVTLATDVNTSATADIVLAAGGDVEPTPDGFDGPTLFLFPPMFMPAMFRQS